MAYLNIASLSFLIKDISKDLIILINDSHLIAVLIFSELLGVLTCVFSVLFLIKLIKDNRIDHKKLFIGLVVLYIITQVLQFSWRYASYALVEGYLTRFSTYNHYLNNNYYLNFIPSVVSILLDLVLVVIFYKNRNLLVVDRSNQSEINQIGIDK